MYVYLCTYHITVLYACHGIYFIYKVQSSETVETAVYILAVIRGVVAEV